MTEGQTERFYSIETVSIRKDYMSNKVFVADITVKNAYGNSVSIKLPTERVLALIDSVSDLVVESLEAQFKNMKEDALEAIEQQKAKMLPPKETVDASES
jgi:hypothetical protein